jgi:flagellar biosynthesis component FlhA
MAIDADLNAGIIDQEEAHRRRVEIAQEADFFGSMDGASKFVRGDAIAAILILFINLIGGLVIGIWQHGLSLGTAAHDYTLLSIGDALVAQIPALVISIAAGIVVSSVNTGQDLGRQLIGQIFQHRDVLVIVTAILGLLGLIPGMPHLPFLTAAGVLAGVVWYQRRRAQQQATETPVVETTAEPEEIGWNSRLDTLQAAVLLVKLRYIERWNQQRQERARTYADLFQQQGLVEAAVYPSHGVVLPYVDPRGTHVFHQYVIRAPRRDALRAFLAERGIGSEIYYPLPLHLQQCFQNLGYAEGAFPESERAAKEVLALPIFPELTQEEQERVVAAIAAFLE